MLPAFRRPGSMDKPEHEDILACVWRTLVACSMGQELAPHPGRGRRGVFGCASLMARSMRAVDGSKEAVVVGGRHDKAQQLGRQVVLRLCQSQLHGNGKYLHGPILSWVRDLSSLQLCTM